MGRWRVLFLLFIYGIAFYGVASLIYWMCEGGKCDQPIQHELILTHDGYSDAHIEGLWDKLLYRVQVQPFNLVAFIIFLIAITHTFFCHKFNIISRKLMKNNVEHKYKHIDSFGVEFMRFMGEVEVVFGIWVIPLLISMTFFYNWNTAINYLENQSYTEPIFVFVIMVIASSKPIVKFAEDCLRFVARLGGQSVKSWWWVILTIGPLSGSFITEPGAMTISALLLAKQFYRLNPSKKFAYSTLGLLFTNVSVGGVLTNFAAPPVLMVSTRWGWSSGFMLKEFGLKAVLGILISNLIYYFIFRKEFDHLDKEKEILQKHEHPESVKGVPFWITLINLMFLSWIVIHSHHPVVFVGSFLLFLGFYLATLLNQGTLELKTPIMVGFFLAGLVVHGSLQSWWIAPLLSNVASGLLLVMSMFLTAFNDNAEITFLATLIPTFTPEMKYAIVAGAVTGGGLTVIANAPNPSGQAILGKYFDQGISMVNLLLGAITPAVIMALCFYLLRPVH